MFVDLESPGDYWTSPDGMVRAGEAELKGKPVWYGFLGKRPVSLRDIDGLLQFMKERVMPANTKKPLLLLSCCPGFAPDVLAEERGLVFFVGHYRRCQQEWRDAGNKIISAIDDVAVGGTYLFHGMSAPTRLATPQTRFYGALPPEVAEAAGFGVKLDTLDKALEIGLVTRIVERPALKDALSAAFSA